MPVGALAWTFPEIRKACYDGETVVHASSSSRWVWQPLSRATRDQVLQARRRGDVQDGFLGEECVLVEVVVGDLAQRELGALDEYRDAIERFGDDLLGCEWAARAMHEARRSGLRVCLPAGRSYSYVIDEDVVETIEINFAANAPIPAVDLGEAIDHLTRVLKILRAATRHAAEARLDEEKRSLRDDELARLQRIATDSLGPPIADGHRRNIERLGRTQTPSAARMKWNGASVAALESARHVLSGERGENRSRKGKERMAPYLNAAVNGMWGASVPLEPTDMGARYFTEYREIANALVGAQKFARAIEGWPAQASQRRPTGSDVTDNAGE